MYRAVLLCCLLLATTAKAAETGPYVTVSALIRLCDSNDREQEFFCRGYLSGLTGTIEDTRRINKSAPAPAQDPWDDEQSWLSRLVPPTIFAATHCRTLQASQWKSRYPGSSPSR